MKKFNLLALVATLFLLSCSDSQTNVITHLPYQMEEKGRWGLIDMEGNPLIEDEYQIEYEFYEGEK